MSDGTKQIIPGGQEPTYNQKKYAIGLGITIEPHFTKEQLNRLIDEAPPTTKPDKTVGCQQIKKRENWAEMGAR